MATIILVTATCKQGNDKGFTFDVAKDSTVSVTVRGNKQTACPVVLELLDGTGKRIDVTDAIDPGQRRQLTAKLGNAKQAKATCQSKNAGRNSICIFDYLET